MVIAEPGSCQTIEEAMAWVTRQKRPIQFDRQFMLPATLVFSLQLFQERYQQGATWKDLQASYLSLTAAGIRKRVRRMTDLLTWLVEGRKNPLFVAPAHWVKGAKSDALYERTLEAAEKYKNRRVMMTEISRMENRERIDNDVPIYRFIGKEESLLDMRLRRRLARRADIRVDRRERKRSLIQELFLLGWPGSVHQKAKTYLGFTPVSAKWLRRNKEATLQKLPYLMACLEEPRVAGWAALSILRLYGLHALPKAWYLQLFSDDRRKMMLDRVWGHDTANKRASRTYARRLWLSFGGTRGVGGALPAALRTKETIRGLFRALRHTLDTLPIDEKGFPPAAWTSPLWDFFTGLRRVERGAGEETYVVSKAMPEETRKKLKLLKAARHAAKQNGVKLRKPKPKKEKEKDGPSEIEQFVITLVSPTPEEARDIERRAERRADRKMARATGGFAFQEEEQFVRNLRLIS